jgi:hypothetical protein
LKKNPKRSSVRKCFKSLAAMEYSSDFKRRIEIWKRLETRKREGITK